MAYWIISVWCVRFTSLSLDERVEFCCIFKTATLVYRFLHSGHPGYFNHLLSIWYERYCTRYNCPDKMFLDVPQHYPSVYKSNKHFGRSFVFDAPTVWNDLPDDVHSAPTLACFRKKAKILTLEKGFPTLAYKLSGVSLVLTRLLSMELWLLNLVMVSRLRVCLGRG